jgi:hypothetical protein
MNYYQPVIAVLAVPENRIKCANQFANQHQHIDPQMYSLAVRRMMDFTPLCDTSESHY